MVGFEKRQWRLVQECDWWHIVFSWVFWQGTGGCWISPSSAGGEVAEGVVI